MRMQARDEMFDDANGDLAIGELEDAVEAVSVLHAIRSIERAEVAVVVAHQEHMRGVGTVLLGRLGQIARDNGLNRFVADVLAENYLMRKVMSDAGWPCTIHADGSELQVDVNLAELAQ